MPNTRSSQHKTSANVKMTAGVLVAAALVIVAVVVTLGRGGGRPAVVADVLVRPDSNRISVASDGKVTVVEFLDFECPSCAAVYPAVEQLRSRYAGKITYVVRYFPLAMHPNAENAARAAQAAADQGRFEAMYQKLFENQARWAHRQQPQTAVFERYAAELGLDMTRFRADVAAGATAERIREDRDDGITLGVQGTPTFFLDGKQFEGNSVAELGAAIDAALAR
jgi:protein-disulfide isomerase